MSSLYTQGSTFGPDIDEAEYLLWSGAFPGGTGGLQNIAKHMSKRLLEGTLKVDVLDPTLANGIVTPTMPGINWVPIKPATNGALYAAVAQQMIADKTYNEEFLSFPNQDAAVAAGYGAHTNATHLVIVDESHPNFNKVMRAADAGLQTPEVEEGKTAPDWCVVIDAQTGEPALNTDCAKADLYFEGEVNGVAVRTGFLMLVDSVNSNTMDEYAQITGVPVDELRRIAGEFGSHGVKVSVNAGAGSTAGQNGFDTPNGREVLKALVGSNQMRGGSFSASGAPVTEGVGARYDIATVEGKPAVSSKNAVMISRTGRAWENTDEYANRVAAGEENPLPKLPWYPMASQSDNQALCSAINQYPYQCKIMMTWMCNVIQATPGAMRDEVFDRLCDPSIVPLHIACDIVMGEMASTADYFVPDVTQFESFGLPTAGAYGTAVRWEATKPLTALTADGRNVCWETLLIDVAKACELPGWGEGAFTDTEGNTYPFNNAYDYYVKAIANLAYADDDPCEDIDPAEAHMQGLDDLPEAFRAAVKDEEWPKVLRVISRGGRFWTDEQHPMRADDGRAPKLKNCMTYIYNEKRATTNNGFSKQSYEGGLKYNEQRFADMSLVTDHYSVEEYPFTASEHKPRFRSISRLADSPVMRDLCAHNYIEMNVEDARALGISDGDMVRAVTPAGDITEGEAMVRAGQVKGSFAVAFGYGHRYYGARDVQVGDEVIPGDPAIAAGTRLMTMLDPVASTDGTLAFWSDNNAASPARCGGIYKIEKA